jgi:phage-related protein
MDEREIDWRGSTYKDLCDMPDKVRQTFGFALGLAQNNLPYVDAKKCRRCAGILQGA